MASYIFDESSSISLTKRPFFSIVVPCYNSRETLGALLESIVLQHMNDEIEVILSDDCSNESYQDIVEQYNQTLCIRQVKTDYNFAPGNTRERGVSIATGEWITFADHDDEFIPDTLKIVKQVLLESKEQYYAICNFYERDPKTNRIIRQMVGTKNWNHAKFYNKDHLWDAFDIHFKKDLLTHEDIYISSLVNCAVSQVNREEEPLFINLFCYIWNNRPTSISREKYGNHTFLEVFYPDYIESTGYVYIDQYLNHGLDQLYATQSVFEVLLYCYFYTESFKFHDPVDYIRDNVDITRQFLIAIKESFGYTNEFIWNFVAQNDANLYVGVRENASIAAGPYIESKTFAQWLDYLHKDIKPRVTMSDAMHK